MAVFSADAGAYFNACNLIKALEQAGIRANITTGGVSIHCSPSDVSLAQKICKDFKASFKAGLTSYQEDVILRSKDVEGVEKLKTATENARSIIKEWKE